MITDVQPKPSSPPVYLGDELYAEFDGYQIRLYASNGVRITNEVFLESSAYSCLEDFAKQVWGKSHG